MRLIILIVGIILSLNTEVFAQRNIPGQKSFEITTGTVDGLVFRTKKNEKKYHVGVGFNSINRKGFRWTVGANFIHRDIFKESFILPTTIYGVQAGFGKTVISDNRVRFCLNISGHVLVGYEKCGKLTDNFKEVIGRKNGLILGPGIKIEIKLYIIDRLSLFAFFQPLYKMGGGYRELLIPNGIGMRININ